MKLKYLAIALCYVLCLSVDAADEDSPLDYDPSSARYSFAIAQKLNPMTDVEIEMVMSNSSGKPTKQIEFERMLEFSTDDVAYIRTFFNNIVDIDTIPDLASGEPGFDRMKQAVWTVAHLKQLSPTDFTKQYRLRFNYEKLGPNSILRPRYIEIDGITYFPSFRLSFKTDANNKMIYTNKYNKFGNMLIVFSPYGIAGRYNEANTSTNIFIINLHLVKGTSRPPYSLAHQFDEIFTELRQKPTTTAIENLFKISAWPPMKSFAKRGLNGNNKFVYECTDDNFMAKIGYDPNHFVLLTEQITFENFLTWR